ncbi:MAG: hypothetical protein KDC80_15625 [Saprospiraceae bacterium]|nr:hypothetical protein [Saprospiraceae bacterium]
MKSTIENPISDRYAMAPELEDLHRQSREWLSDMAFWKDEADFLRRLIDKNFVHLMTGEGMETAFQLSKKIAHLGDTQVKNLIDLVEIHEGKLAELIENPQEKREESFRKEHRLLAIKFREVAMQNMSIKRRIFAAAEKILHDEKIKALTSH